MKLPNDSLSRRRILKLLGAAATSAALPAFGRPFAQPARGTASPATITGPVLIIGAGMAGLTAANALGNAGVPCILIEARNRIGGRLWTQNVGGIPIDMGGAWIHDPVGNPMTSFADQAGVGYTLVNPIQNPLAIHYYQEGVGSLNDLEKLQVFLGYEGFELTLGKWSRKLGPNASVEQAVNAYLDSFHQTPEVRARMAHACRFVNESFDATDWSNDSLYYLANPVINSFKGNQFGNFPTGGYITLVNAMANGIKGGQILLNHQVSQVSYDDNGVTVQAIDTSNGGDQPVTLTGSHCIVTLPLGVLKAGSVAFSPGLPEAKLAAIENIGWGNFEKVSMSFASPWWEQAHPKQTHFLFESASTTSPMEFPFFIDLQEPLGLPALVGVAVADFAKEFALMTDDQIRTRVMQIFTEAYGSRVQAPTDLHVSRWTTDPYSLGCYSNLALGSNPASMDTLAEPVNERLLFAGEATYKTRYGYADGALSSGLREAQRLLGITPVITPGSTGSPV